MKHLLALLILLAFVAGCADKVQAEYSTSFSAEYYILKKPTSEEFSSLRRHLYSSDSKIQAAAGVILAFYYVQTNDFDSARLFLNRYAASPDLSATMRKFAEYVRFEYALRQKDEEGVKQASEDIPKGLDEPAKRRAGELYCATLRIPVYNNNVYSCVTARIAVFEKEESEGLLVPELPKGGGEYLKSVGGPLNILVMSSGDTGDAGSGVFYYTNSGGLEEHKIRVSKSYREGDWDFVLDIDHSYLGGRGYGIYFDADASAMLARFYDYADLSCRRVMIGTSRKNLNAAKELLASLREAKRETHMVDISNPSVGRDMRAVLAVWEQEGYCAVGAGSEEEINNFVPNVRQYLRRRDQRIYVIEDVFSGKQLTKDYLSYYTGVRIYPVIDMGLRGEITAFAQEYETFSGRPLTYEALIGYEMMHYIHSLVLGGETGNPYYTNITGIKDGRVVRSPLGFYITNKGVEELSVTAPE